MADSVTVVPAPNPAPPIPVAPPASKSKIGLLIGVAAVFLILLVAGVAGFLVWKKNSSSPATNTTNVNTTAGVATAPVEVSRYWIELEPGKRGEQKDGYLYIIGPGEKNQPTAFLTSKPSSQTGLKSNKVSKGVDFSFPKADEKNENSLTLDKRPGTDNFTIIFSTTPLSSPSFLNEAVTGDPLTAAQQAELKDFISRYQSKPPVTELDESNASAPFVRVKAAPDQTSNPLVFDIRIQHN
jgi:hypothetical protein